MTYEKIWDDLSGNGQSHTDSNSNSKERGTREEKSTVKDEPVKDEHYYAQVLNIAPGANLAEIKRAYREQVKKYHPDRVNDLGDEFKELATRKTKDLNAAIEFFKEKLGR